MTKAVGDLSAYEVSAVIPTGLITPLLQLLQRNGGHLVRMISHNGAGQVTARKHSKLPAHEVILTALQEENGETHRADLRKALELSGHSPSSVGPICSMLSKQGRIISPRRGFWQIRA